MPNYNNGKVYKIVNNIDNMIYIGSTTTRLCQRMNVHRCHMRNNNNNATLYKHMRELGLENFTIVLIEDYSCNSKDQLLRRERYIFDLHDKQVLLNSNRPIVTCVERIQYNKKNCKIWYNNNREHGINKAKNWYLNNKLHVKNRHLNNRLQIKIYKQKYNEHQKIMMELPFYRVPITTSF